MRASTVPVVAVSAPNERTTEEPTPVATLLDGVIITEDLVLWVGKTVQVPLGELCGVLEVPCRLDVPLGKAEGGLFDSAFRLDSKNHTLVLRGQTISILASDAVIREGDLHVSLSLLARILPIKPVFNSGANELTLATTAPMPVQARLARERRRIRGVVDPNLRHKGFVRTPDPYEPWSVPAMDVAVSAGGGTSARLQYGTDLSAAGDLLWATGFASVHLAPGAPVNLVGYLGRSDPDGGLLGPLDAKTVQGGYVSAPSYGLAASGGFGPGFVVTNSPLDSSGRQERWALRGRLPRNWQVELYHNGTIVGFQSAGPSETYEFKDLPMVMGENLMKLVFYGPGGEKREEITRINSMDMRPKQGETWYRISGTRGDALDHTLRFGASSSYGITRDTMVDGLFASVMRPGMDAARYVEAGLSTLGSRTLLGLSVTERLDEPGRALHGSLQYGFGGGQTFMAEGSVFQSGFRADGLLATATDVPMASVVQVATTGQFPSTTNPWGSYSLSANQTMWVDGRRGDGLAGRLGISTGHLSFTEEIVKNWSRNALGVTSTSGTSTTTVSYPRPNWLLTGSAVINQDGRLDRVGALFNYRFPDFVVTSTYTRDGLTGGQAYGLGISKLAETYQLSLQFSFFGKSWSGMLSYRMGLTRDPVAKRWSSSGSTATTSGAVLVRAYLDSNGNGVRDPGERVLANAKAFASGGRDLPAQATHWFGDGLSAARNVYVELDEETLEDPVLRPGLPGYRIVPRRGHVTKLDFPVIAVSDVTGTTYLRDKDGVLLPLPGVTLELLSEGGVVAATTRASFDGFYDFEEVKPGRYTLRVSPDLLKRRRLMAPEAKAVYLPASGASIANQDFVLQPEGNN